jgi:hypothetical protein
MLDLTRDFQSLSFFRRKIASFSKMLRKSQRPLVLTHNGRPELVVQSVKAYQRLLDIAARQDAGGAKGGTPELYFTDPDGITIQIQETKYCGGVGYLGEVCR